MSDKRIQEHLENLFYANKVGYDLVLNETLPRKRR